ncbi:unnamed protein product [Closterium sp. NIES-54]
MLLAPEGDPNAPDIPTLRSYAEEIEGPYSFQWQTAMDTEMASWKSAGTYVDEVPPPGVNIVSGMWIFRVKWPPSSPPVFKARYIARGFSQRQGVDFFHTFSLTPKMTTLRHSLPTGSLHEEIWLRRPPGFTGSFPAGTQWSLRRPVYGLHQAPREWHDTLRTTLATLGFDPSTTDPSLFLRTNTTLPPFYVLVYVDDLVFATADTESLTHVKSELQKRHTCTDLGELTSYLGLRITQDIAQRTITLTQSHIVLQVLQRFGFTYSSPQSTPLPTGHLLSAPPSDDFVEPSGPFSCEAEIYAEAMVAQDLRWLTYLLSNLGEPPYSTPVLYIDNNAMIALCQEHILEHRTKHIALRYSFARELQQRGQLRLAYVATRANTADVFTKALQPCDHQRFCTVLGLVVFSVLLFLLYITLHVNWPCGHLLVLKMRGDVVIHPELALPFLTGLVSYLYPSACHISHSFLHYSDSLQPARRPLQPARRIAGRAPPFPPARHSTTCSRAALLAACRHFLPAGRSSLPACRPAGSRTTLPCLRAALLAVALPCPANCAALPLLCATPPYPANFPCACAPPCPSRCPCLHAALLVARHPALPAMATLSVLTFDPEDRPIQFDTWLDDLQLYLLSDSRDGVSLFDLTLDPTYLTVDLLEKHLLEAETSVVAIGAACGTPRTPFSEGCSPSPLVPSYASAAAVDILGIEDVRAASAPSGKRRSGKCKGGKSGGGGSRGGGGGGSGGSGGGRGGGGSGGGSGGFGGGGGGSGGSGGGGGGGSESGGGGSGGGRGGAVWRGGSGGGQRQQQQRWSETPTPQQLREWFAQHGASGGSVRPMPPDPGIEAAALGASESALPGTAPVAVVHTFTLDSVASRCFFHDSTTLTPLPAPVLVRLADPSGGPILARSSTFLPCSAVPSVSLSGLHLPSFSMNMVITAALHDAMVTTTTPWGQRVSICTCTRTGRHLATFTRRPGSSPSGSSPLLVSPLVALDSPVAPPPWSPLWLSSRTIPCVFLGFPPDAPGWQFYHPTSRRFLSSQDFTFDESVPFYRLFPYCTDPLPPLPLFLAPGPPPVDHLPPEGLAPSGVSQVDPLPLAEPVEVTIDSGAARGAAFGSSEPASAECEGEEPANAEPGGAERGGAELGGAEPEGVEPGGVESEGAESEGVEPRGTACAGGLAGASPRQSHQREPLSPQQLREWFAQRTCLRNGTAGARGPAAGGTGAGGVGAASPGGARALAGAGGTGGTVVGGAEAGGARDGDPGAGGPAAGGSRAGVTSPGGAGVTARVGGPRVAGAAGHGGAPTRGTGAAGAGGVGGTGAGDPGVGGTGAGDRGAGGTGTGGARAGGAGAAGAGAGDPRAGGACAGGAGGGGTGAEGTMQRRPFFVPPPPSSLPPPDSVVRQSQPQLKPDSPLPAPSPYAQQTDSLTERREPESCPASHVRAVHTGCPRPRPPPVPVTHIIGLRPSSVPLRDPLLSPPASSLADGPDPESDLVRDASSTVTRLLATVDIDPSFESTAASALVAELVDFAAA